MKRSCGVPRPHHTDESGNERRFRGIAGMTALLRADSTPHTGTSIPSCTGGARGGMMSPMKRALCLVMLAACSQASSQPPAVQPVKHEDRHDPAVAAPPLELAVHVGEQTVVWHQDVFDRVPHFASANHDGESRDTWSLRELAHAAAGPSARVVAVLGDTRKAIDAAAWDDPARTPIVHRTRRGWLKFRWADKDGQWSDAEVKDVVGLELVR